MTYHCMITRAAQIKKNDRTKYWWACEMWDTQNPPLLVRMQKYYTQQGAKLSNLLQIWIHTYYMTWEFVFYTLPKDT